MKALIVCVSVSHGNTRRVADALADVLHATVVEPEEVDPDALADYDIVGFGSGIYYSSPHRRLRDLVDRLPDGGGAKAFVFATSGRRELWGRFTRQLEKTLEQRNYDVLGTFICRGWDTWLPLRLIGGVNRGHPDEHDLIEARSFARTMSDSLSRREVD
jgi:flavodoxin